MMPPETRAWAEINLDAVRANVRALKQALPKAQLLAVVKADAYGHGLLPVARAATEAGADWLGVATAAEGVALREAGLVAPILLLCAPAPDEAEALIASQLTAQVGDETTLTALARAAESEIGAGRPPAVHLDVDTGMGRSGVAPEASVGLWRAATAAGLRVTGLTTHFADADGPSETFTDQQRRQFAQARGVLENAGARFDLIHLSNSAATARFGDCSGNLVRPGLLLYGIRPPIATSREPISVTSALTLKARVATVRGLPAGHAVSYGATHILTRPSRVATVLIGYGDGYPRRLSNCGAMLLRGRRAPILGSVCMDQTVVDVTDIPDVAPGEVAICLGAQGSERISVEEIAALMEAAEHEITTGLTPRIPRRYSETL